MGYRLQASDKVYLGKRLLKREDYVYVLLNKPKDYITTTKDPRDRKTVMDLVKKAADVRLYPVGRLDRQTTGLLLLTNDGELAERLSHPSNNIRKIYKVELDKPLTKRHFQEIGKGLTLDGQAYLRTSGLPDKKTGQGGICRPYQREPATWQMALPDSQGGWSAEKERAVMTAG